MAKNKFGYEDSLDVVGIHGVGGLLGTLCVGIFVTKAINPGGANGLLADNPALLGTQALGVVVVGVYTLV